MRSLTVCYTTSRHDSRVQWFLDSLRLQPGYTNAIKIIIIDLHCPALVVDGNITRTPPKPNIWQGPSRITNKDFWAKSNALNTGICLCNTEWIAFVDDRSVLAPTWLQAVSDAVLGNYVVAGAYEKWANMVVENGAIKSPGTLLGKDGRHGHPNKAVPIHGGAFYGCTNAMPVEWALRVGGVPEDCDGIGSEDSMFGLLLSNNKLPIRYDTRMKIIEDRTPEELTEVVRRSDSGVSPNDKSHALVERFRHQTTSMNPFDIRKMRDTVLAGGSFPLPTASHVDWYNGAPIKDMV